MDSVTNVAIKAQMDGLRVEHKLGVISEERFEEQMDALMLDLLQDPDFEDFMTQDTPFEAGEERFEHFSVGYNSGEQGHDLFHVAADGSVLQFWRYLEHSQDVVSMAKWYCDEECLDFETLWSVNHS
jgi:hypothetical protein